MAYEALDTLQQTLDQILQRYDNPIIIRVKPEILSIRLQAVVLQMNLKSFPDKERIREVANTTYELIDYLFSDENLSDESTAKLTDKLRELAEKLKSTAGDMVDYINSKDAVSGLRPPTDSQAVSSSSRAATPKTKDVVVGLDKDLEEMKYQLAGGVSARLHVLPIVGTGGIGKTTLAKTIYNDALSKQYFRTCGWVTISQEYSVASIALNLLASMKGISKERDVESTIPVESLIREHLKSKRYLIVMDDVCSKKAWDDLHMLFPEDNSDSRIIITTRLYDVAAYVASSRYIHTMRLLDAHHSWNLLKRKVFDDEDCPLEREDIGKKIVKSCGGLPLSIVLVAGLLSKNHTRDSWKQIAANGAKLETIICSSFTQLPYDFKACLLYMAGFPEDYEIRVSELINLWIAEGFLKLSNQSKSLEEGAKKCVEELVERSLVLVASKKVGGEIKSCSLHDIVRDFCVRQARKEKVILPVVDYLPTPILRRHFLPRLIEDYPRISATSYDLHLKDSMHSSHTRTIICIPKKGYRPVGSVEKYSSLRVLHVLRRSNNWDWEPGRVFDLIHLTYLASNIPNSIVPSAILKLQNLQTFIIYRSGVHLPVEIWTLRQLRHLIAFSFHPLPHPKGKIIPLENLETLSLATDFMCSEGMVEMIPNIKKLGLCYSKKMFDEGHHLNGLKYLRCLEKLKLEICEDFTFRQLDEMEMKNYGDLFNQLDGLECRKQVYVEGMRVGTLSGDLDEFEQQILSRQPDEFLEMDGRFLSTQLYEFVQEMRDDSRLEMPGGSSCRLVDKHVFPLALRRLTLSGCRLSWSDMTVIGSLPKLQVLKLRNYACRGLRWETNEGEFGELRLLLIEKSILRYWNIESRYVLPKLEFIMLHGCPLLSTLPSEIGGIPTLKLIEVDERNKDLWRSAKVIENRCRESGKGSFQVRVKRS